MSFQEAAFLAHRAGISQLFEDRCTVVEQYNATDQQTHRTRKETKVLYRDVPCRLSFSSLSPAAPDKAAKALQTVTLFTGPDIRIPAGSRVRVLRTGETSEWKLSGVPASYSTHREYPLEIYEEHT